MADQNFQIKAHTSQYYASQLINLEWVKHGDGLHKIFAASCDLKDVPGHVLVTAYAVQRPDGDWSLLLVNRDQSNSHAVRVVFDVSTNNGEKSFSGPVTMVTFGSEQYVWHSEGPISHPDPDTPPLTTTVSAGADTSFTLPRASITVLRGKVEGLTN